MVTVVVVTVVVMVCMCMCVRVHARVCLCVRMCVFTSPPAATGLLEEALFDPEQLDRFLVVQLQHQLGHDGDVVHVIESGHGADDVFDPFHGSPHDHLLEDPRHLLELPAHRELELLAFGARAVLELEYLHRGLEAGLGAGGLCVEVNEVVRPLRRQGQGQR